MGLLSTFGFGKESKKASKEVSKSEAHKSRWGYHSTNHEDFLILKALHKRYWKTQRQAYAWQRWISKTVNQVGPEPKIDELFINTKKRSYFTTVTNKGDTRWHNLRFTRNLHCIVKDFRIARMPAEKPEDVEIMSEQMEFYKDAYEKMIK